jgi:hypothetical protein
MAMTLRQPQRDLGMRLDMASGRRPTVLAVAVVASLALHLLWWLPADPAPPAGPRCCAAHVTLRSVSPATAPTTASRPPLTELPPWPSRPPTPNAPQTGPEPPHASRDDSQYLPPSALTLAPVVQGPVLLAYPDNAPSAQITARLTLFIDEAGQVQHIRLEGAGLPPAFEQAVRSAFMTTRWTPGERDGQPVKARHVIEVEFAEDPVTRTAGSL